MPYDYKYLFSYPTNIDRLSLLNSTNRNEIKKVLNKNVSKNALDINFWNYNLIIDSYSKETNKNFENSFIKLFFLTKNNQNKTVVQLVKEIRKILSLITNYFLKKIKN